MNIKYLDGREGGLIDEQTGHPTWAYVLISNLLMLATGIIIGYFIWGIKIL